MKPVDYECKCHGDFTCMDCAEILAMSDFLDEIMGQLGWVRNRFICHPWFKFEYKKHPTSTIRIFMETPLELSIHGSTSSPGLQSSDRLSLRMDDPKSTDRLVTFARDLVDWLQ